MMKALIDTCIVVDVLQKREPFFEASMKIFVAVAQQQCIGVLTAKSIMDIHYLLQRSLHDEEKTRKLLRTLFSLFAVEDVCAMDCQLAMSSLTKDYEDAIMIEAAKRLRLDCIVTRNLKDYMVSDVPVYAPEAFLPHLPSYTE